VAKNFYEGKVRESAKIIHIELDIPSKLCYNEGKVRETAKIIHGGANGI
jgi:hypothetical protein